MLCRMPPLTNKHRPKLHKLVPLLLLPPLLLQGKLLLLADMLTSCPNLDHCCRFRPAAHLTLVYQYGRVCAPEVVYECEPLNKLHTSTTARMTGMSSGM